MKIKRIFLIIGILILSGFTLFIGMEIGRNHSDSIPEAPDVIKFFASAIKNIPGIPFEIELNQEKLNEIMNKNQEKLLPLTGAKLTISKDKTLILTGNVEKTEISNLLDGELPSYISIFLPQTISLYIEIQFPEEESESLQMKIKNVTVSGVTFSEDFTETLGINEMATKLLTETLSSESSPYYKLSGISVRESKKGEETVIVIKGTAKIS